MVHDRLGQRGACSHTGEHASSAGMDGAMHFTTHIEWLEAAVSRLAEGVGGDDPAAPIVTCPGWTVLDLVQHCGGLYLWADALVARGITKETWRVHLGLTYPSADDDLLGWLDDAAASALATFRAADPDSPVFVWGADHHNRFWPRRMLYETVVHGADLDLSIGRPVEISDAVALEGIDEFLENMMAMARWGSTPMRWDAPGDSGRTSVGLRIDGVPEAAWSIRLTSSGFWWDRSARDNTATISGSAADVMLYLQGRPGPSVRLAGDGDVVAAWRSMLAF
jgi:uncharacterized protein (TIGR03083 family)